MTAAGNGSKRIVLRRPRSPGINSRPAGMISSSTAVITRSSARSQRTRSRRSAELMRHPDLPPTRPAPRTGPLVQKLFLDLLFDFSTPY